jgi:hypothetical protein
MPYSSRKIKKGCIQVYNIKTRKVYSKCTTRKNSEKQLRLLRALEYNPDFKLRKPNSSKRKTVKRKI